jgi:hypothetical protein
VNRFFAGLDDEVVAELGLPGDRVIAWPFGGL